MILLKLSNFNSLPFATNRKGSEDYTQI